MLPCNFQVKIITDQSNIAIYLRPGGGRQRAIFGRFCIICLLVSLFLFWRINFIKFTQEITKINAIQRILLENHTQLSYFIPYQVKFNASSHCIDRGWPKPTLYLIILINHKIRVKPNVLDLNISFLMITHRFMPKYVAFANFHTIARFALQV